jgi:hypothetical protein
MVANYYVGSGGSDANAGTSWALRKLTIQAAINVATTAGDSIFVAPGVYRETCTMGTSGTAGNVISLIGDYTGANTSGAKGVVRITGSADDIALTRNNAIFCARQYIRISGFLFDLTKEHAINLSKGNVQIDHCCFQHWGIGYAIATNTHDTGLVVFDCVFEIWSQSAAISWESGGQAQNIQASVYNCLFIAKGLLARDCGGINFANCTFIAAPVYSYGTIPAGFTPITFNNCIFVGATTALQCTPSGEITEDYNTFYGNATNRINVAAGANSVTRPPLFDTRWFFEMVNGGRLITPFDLASYSQLVEYTSGTGAPSTDIRGSSQVGSYRELGAVEYDSTLSIAGGAGLITHPGMGGGIRG